MEGILAERLKSAVRMVTRRFRDKRAAVMGGEFVTVPHRSQQARDLQELMDSGAFGCECTNAARAFSILLQEEITSRQDYGRWNRVPVGPLAAVGLTRELFRDKKTYLVYNLDRDGDAFLLDVEGNRAGVRVCRSDQMQLATEEEINRFVDSLAETRDVKGKIPGMLAAAGF